MMLRDLIQLMFIGLAFLLPITAPASTTYPVANRTVVEQIISAYDADSVHSISDNVWAGSEAMAQPVTFFGSVGGLVAAKSTSKGVQLVEDIVGPNAKATLNEAGDLVIESQNGLTKVRFDINRTVPHKNSHAHVEVFEQVKNKKVPVQKSGPIYPKDVPHE
jgi:hypothetical protein